MYWMYSTRTYGLKIRYTTCAAGAINWVDDEVRHQNVAFTMRQFRGWIHGLTGECQIILIRSYWWFPMRTTRIRSRPWFRGIQHMKIPAKESPGGVPRKSRYWDDLEVVRWNRIPAVWRLLERGKVDGGFSNHRHVNLRLLILHLASSVVRIDVFARWARLRIDLAFLVWCSGWWFSHTTGAQLAEDTREGRWRQEHTSEVGETSVVFHELAVLCAKLICFLGLLSNFAFELTNVFCKTMLVLILSTGTSTFLPLRRERKDRAETLFLSWRLSLLLSFLPSSLASRRSSSSISSSSFFMRAARPGWLPVGVSASSAEATLLCLIWLKRREMCRE